MFRNRRSQKPSDDLYKSFKANFPQVNRPPSTDHASSTAHIDAKHATTSLTDALDIPLEPRPAHGSLIAAKDLSSTPRGTTEPWSFGASGLTPSLLDPAGHGYNVFANHLPEYYTPTSAGLTMYHHQAGDLHTPNYGLGFATPLSISTSEGPVPAGELASAFHGFQPHSIHHAHHASFDGIDPFHPQPAQSFPPHHFSNHHVFGHYDAVLRESPTEDAVALLSPPQPDNVPLARSTDDHERIDHSTTRGTMPPPPLQLVGERFKYHVTLNAPTAMIKHVDEIPITYLNKGQVYSLNVVDTRPRHSSTSPRYRTFVRISFEDDQQRERPAICWQLWKEGRGTNEAHQRGGRLQAVEHVESGQSNAEDLGRPRIELQNASFDGFCVTWSPPLGSNECSIAVRFNFLSTDFSHSKGVKGIPVRLCAKTELLQEATHTTPASNIAEVCYCKVKLFRDHGAERKLSNDIAHVKKTIDKLNQQIIQIESGMRDNSKRKRSIFSKSGDERPSKVAKHRRTWSTSSLTASGSRNPAGDELHLRLASLQDMFTSTRPASVLHLKGAKEDDPDLYPVKLSTTDAEILVRHDSGGSTWDRRSTSSLDSPSPSNKSLTEIRRDSTLHPHSIKSASPRSANREWYEQSQTATADLISDHHASIMLDSTTLQAVKVRAKSPTQPWLDVIDLDPEYEPPPPRTIMPVACVYVKKENDTVYRAVYLKRRTFKDMVNAIALKMGVESTKILQTVRINRCGLHILFDDDCVRELTEGQDMIVDLAQCRIEDTDEHVHDSGAEHVQTDSDVPVGARPSSTGYKLILRF